MTRWDTTLPELNGVRVLVTGASGNLGRGIARRFAAAGAHVALHYRASAEKAFDVVQEIRSRGGEATAVQANLTEPGAAHTLIARTVDTLGGIDGLVNNAGIQTLMPLERLTRSEWDTMLATNLGTVFELSQAAAQEMKHPPSFANKPQCAHPHPHPPGRWITHIASIEASRPAPSHAHYAAAKAAVVMHARAAALELGPSGIRVNTVSPGLIDRPGLAENWPEGVASWVNTSPLGRLCTVDDIGNACVLLASPAASCITGHNLVVDGGMLATPGW